MIFFFQDNNLEIGIPLLTLFSIISTRDFPKLYCWVGIHTVNVSNASNFCNQCATGSFKMAGRRQNLVGKFLFSGTFLMVSGVKTTNDKHNSDGDCDKLYKL